MSIGETVEGACGATLRLNEWLFTMDNADLTKLIAAQIALRFLSGLLFLLSLPLALIALISIGKFLEPTNSRHALLELALMIGSVSGLLAPLAFISPRQQIQMQLLAVSTIVVAVAIVALYSPLCRGFMH
ncbi:hypothetical protein [Roseimicrobium sp. ORNL1]|uniref:hypothetical protein n=1 Tax=Roseimicrobium sp. ORNL1 TaxID=2711231 RepID=UPI0013E134C3|nr:hypothetical protein [Roseimicrobium sp. ORNL1]QIF04818.1 hypothetical protein G5S37_25985 [Roseimicrobium sp. ORNL1]